MTATGEGLLCVLEVMCFDVGYRALRLAMKRLIEAHSLDGGTDGRTDVCSWSLSSTNLINVTIGLAVGRSGRKPARLPSRPLDGWMDGRMAGRMDRRTDGRNGASGIVGLLSFSAAAAEAAGAASR